jgi:hypothetical protein
MRLSKKRAGAVPQITNKSQTQNYKLQTLLWKRNTKTIMGHEVNLQAVVGKMKINGGTQEGEESVKVNHEWEW